MNRNDKGFSIVGGLLVVAIVGIIGLVGWYVWSNREGTEASTADPSARHATAEQLTESAASSFITEFYNKYTRLDPPGNPVAEENLLKQYGTDKLLAYFKENQKGVDPILCAQADPESIKITRTSKDQNTVTVAVEEIFDTDKVDITATVINQNGLKIDTLRCSNPLPAGDSKGP